MKEKKSKKNNKRKASNITEDANWEQAFSEEPKIIEFLKRKRETEKDSVTVQGVMIQLYNIPKEKIASSFNKWEKEHVDLYWKIKKILDEKANIGVLEKRKWRKQGTPYLYRYKK